MTFDEWLIKNNAGFPTGYGSEPKYFGARLKKNGTPGLRFEEIWRMPYGKRLVVANAIDQGREPQAKRPAGL